MFREIGVLELDQQPNLMFLFEIFQQLRRFLGFPLRVLRPKAVRRFP